MDENRLKRTLAERAVEWIAKVSTVALNNEVTILTDKKLTEAIKDKRVTQSLLFVISKILLVY